MTRLIITEDFTMEDAFDIQSQHIAEWKDILNDAAFNLLQTEVDRRNKAGYRTPYDVFRGNDIDQFIANIMNDARNEKNRSKS